MNYELEVEEKEKQMFLTSATWQPASSLIHWPVWLESVSLVGKQIQLSGRSWDGLGLHFNQRWSWSFYDVVEIPLKYWMFLKVFLIWLNYSCLMYKSYQSLVCHPIPFTVKQPSFSCSVRLGCRQPRCDHIKPLLHQEPDHWWPAPRPRDRCQL